MGKPLRKKNTKPNTLVKERIFNSVKEHSLLTELPEMCVPYSVRQVHGGRVTYFNFGLAKEMGVIPRDFDEVISKELEEALLGQFNIRIINEYDRINHTQYKSEDIKPFKCFSTRYLQLQHKNKKGRTSGDGRAIWNGEVNFNGKTWDLNSRGTGVTCMAPGLVEANIPLETGNEEFGYSCGLSEIPEIYATCVMSERFHKYGISTERILVAIDNGKGLGVCVRAHENLVRPAHLFRYLKLNDQHGVRALLSHCINRDFKNKKINFKSEDKNSFKRYLDYISDNFVNLCALAYHKEIFLWLDWDGDNILVDGGIIDYGSVRRFGLHHNRYKYDDVSRFSTCLDEQVKKGKGIIQIFAQLVDFALTGKKRLSSDFLDHNSVKEFDYKFNNKLREYFLEDLGLSLTQIRKSMSWHRAEVESVYSEFLNLQKRKVSGEVATLDGVNRWPALNMNVLLNDVEKLLKNDFKVDAQKYLSDFTEYPVEHENIDEIKQDLISFLKNLRNFGAMLNTKIKYSGDFKQRLTTSAVLDLIEQAQEGPERKIQKSLVDCIAFGFEKDSAWVKKAKKLYRDDL